MDYQVDDIEKILGFKSWDDKKKVDELLRIDAAMYCNLGSESTKADKDAVRKSSRKIYQAIKQVDPYWGEKFLRAMDAKS